MRADEKIDPQLELEAEADQVVALEEEQEPEHEKADEVDTSSIHFHELAAFIEALIAGGATDLRALAWLSDTERGGLALLEEAIVGKHSGGGNLYAEDRLAMLNLALAALQPVLATGGAAPELEARDLYHTLVDEIANLQQSLVGLADAQEELSLTDQLGQLRDGEKPGTKPPDAGEVGDDRPSKLAGPGPAVEKPAAPSQLAGPGPAVEKPAAPSQLAGPGPAVEKPAVPSQLASGGAAAPEKKPQPSTAWDGDERARR